MPNDLLLGSLVGIFSDTGYPHDGRADKDSMKIITNENTIYKQYFFISKLEY